MRAFRLDVEGQAKPAILRNTRRRARYLVSSSPNTYSYSDQRWNCSTQARTP